MALASLRSPTLHAALTTCVLAMGSASAIAFEQRFTYRINMAPYGDIGVYNSAVDKVGETRTITTEAHVKVSLLGITVYRQDISRVERQVGNKLVYFHGITVENGNSFELDGRVEGDHFRLTAPSGSVNVPTTIRTSDPWSAGFSKGDNIIFMTDTGAVTRVVTTGGEQTSVAIDGALLRVHRYQVDTADGRERYQVWIDDYQIPVMFSRVDSDGTVTFTLTK